MGKIFYIMGKSATGKDTIYKELLKRLEGIKTITLYTTRPIRIGEKDGVEYHFVDEKRLEAFMNQGKVVEVQTFYSVYGAWKYFTVDDGQIDLDSGNYLGLGTLASYNEVRKYFGKENLVPIYIEVPDGERLIRAVGREKKQKEPNYEEVCRRFLADSEDFKEKNLEQAEIKKRFQNNQLQKCLYEIQEYMTDIVPLDHITT